MTSDSGDRDRGPAGWGPPAEPPPSWPPPAAAGADAAGPVPLRPLDVGDVLDGTFRLLRADWRALLFLTAVFYAPVTLASTWLQRELLTGPGLFDSVVGSDLTVQVSDLDRIVASSFLLSLVGFLIVEPVVEGAIARIAASTYLGGSASWREGAAAGLRRAGALIGARVLVTLAVLAVFLPGAAAVVGAVLAGSVLLGVLGAILLLVGVLGALLVWALFVGAPAAIVVEGVGPVGGLRRSARLLRPRLWGVLGIMLLATLIAALVSAVIGFPFNIVGQVAGGATLLVLVAVSAMLQSMLSRPLTVLPQTLLYFDGRVRREGLDLQLSVDQGRQGW